MMAKVAGAPQRRALRAVLEEGGGGSTMTHLVRVSLLPTLRLTLTDTLARAEVGRSGLGVVSQMVTEVRMEGDGKRARRVVLAVRRW